MAKTKNSASDKEQEYLKIIEETKNKLKKLQRVYRPRMQKNMRLRHTIILKKYYM